jgi:serine/threonine-protein kinase HipA
MSLRFMLDVWLDGPTIPAGALAVQDDKSLTFTYAPSYLAANFPPLSLSIPLTDAETSDAGARAFFGNLLPENDGMARIFERHGLDRDDIGGILFHAGADCAGAISCLPKGSPPAKVPGLLAEDYRPLPEAELNAIAASLADFRRIPPEVDDPSPVAGVQGKIALTCLPDGQLALPKAGRHVPTTHILKVPPRAKSGEAAHEAASARLARALGLHVAVPEAVRLGDVDALLIERFDRIIEDGTVYRVHQEDFAQALGLPASLKYERHGTAERRFDAASVAALLGHAAVPAVAREAFLLTTFFNLAVGNNDNHAKNHALLYTSRAPVLAPLYDLLPVRLDGTVTHDLAFRMGGATKLEDIDRSALDAFLSVFGLEGARRTRFVKLIGAMFRQLETEAAALAPNGFKRFDDLIGRELGHLEDVLGIDLGLRERDYFTTQGGGWQIS